MYSDIGNWVNFLNSELLGGEVMDKMKLCKELKLTSLSVLKDYVKDLKGRELTKKLIELKYGFEVASYQIRNDNLLRSNDKLPFLAITESLLLLIKKTELEALKEGKKFNCIKFLIKFEKDLKKSNKGDDILSILGSDECLLEQNTKKKTVDKTIVDDSEKDFVKKVEKLYKSIISKKEVSKKDENEEDTEYEDDSDDEDIVEEEEDEYDDDEDDEEDEDEDESEESEELEEDEDEEDEDEEDEEYEEDDDHRRITRSQTRGKRGGFYVIMNRRPSKKRKINDRSESKFIDAINSMIEKNGSKGLKDEEERQNFEDKLLKHFSKFNKDKKQSMLEKFNSVINSDSNIEPILFKIINLNIPNEQKNDIINEYLNIEGSYSDKQKLKTWLENVLKIPFGVEVGKNFSELKDPIEIKNFVEDMKESMDNAVHGHDEAKKNIVEIMVQYITNPDSNGSCVGIWGPPGNGKTTLIKEGIAKAMGREFIFISLGGASDSSYLEGHSFTYEGSVYGRIAQGLMKCKCMNPIIYFDELDKVSEGHRGMEIINLLIHLIDPVQNTEFVDKYFYNIKLDLSKVTFMFSYNDPSKIDPILRDRITQIQTKFLMLEQKIFIAKNYLLPGILKDVGIEEEGVQIKSDLLEYIISSYTNEGGVRKIKKILYSLVRQLNILNLTRAKINKKTVLWPFKLKKDHLETLMSEFSKVEIQKVHEENKVGVINGLWAGSLGMGGILTIESKWIPSKDRNFVEATGSLEKVIKESIKVANTVAWSLLNERVKRSLEDRFEKDPYGIHIHCPDGATPKDGPSAGTALTVLLYSLYNNKKIKREIAITGEINLQGDVLEIGGLEEKLNGAKKAGVKVALIPNSNLKDIPKIKNRSKNLIDDEFEVIPVSNVKEVLDLVLCEPEGMNMNAIESKDRNTR